MANDKYTTNEQFCFWLSPEEGIVIFLWTHLVEMAY